ncbi:MAG: pectin esterase [Prevotella sp.]|nr:pectin esterase [Prevotella sp.]
MLRRLFIALSAFLAFTLSLSAASPFDNADTIVVARDGTGQFRTVDEAIEVCRAFMDYHKVIFVKKGVYKEKITIPQWLQNIEIVGEDRDATIITYDDHANIKTNDRPQGMGTFRTFTLKIEGNDITLRNITIENNAARLGQAVALHTQGDRLTFVNCRFLGNQDTVYTGNAGCRHYFDHCYIEGTTDFIFGPATAWFEQCDIYCKANSYITAASTPQDQPFGYVFNRCTVRTAPEVTKLYLGRPWRDYGYTLFMHCQLPAAVTPEGWHRWEPQREQTARYAEYENTGEGAVTQNRVFWSRQLNKKEARQVTLESVFCRADNWMPAI